ncbi:MAG: hypothetical protein VKK59_06770 [Vampirovibrionales bacterium]|nr:hypothetical protein [Vampirovibrionales bacterium]
MMSAVSFGAQGSPKIPRRKFLEFLTGAGPALAATAMGGGGAIAESAIRERESQSSRKIANILARIMDKSRREGHAALYQAARIALMNNPDRGVPQRASSGYLFSIEMGPKGIPKRICVKSTSAPTGSGEIVYLYPNPTDEQAKKVNIMELRRPIQSLLNESWRTLSKRNSREFRMHQNPLGWLFQAWNGLQ